MKIDNLGLESIIDGKVNPIFNLITTVLSEIYSLEEQPCRAPSGRVHQAKLRGDVYKGRQLGTVDTPEQTLQKHKKTVRAIKTYPTLSLRQIAKLAKLIQIIKYQPIQLRR